MEESFNTEQFSEEYFVALSRSMTKKLCSSKLAGFILLKQHIMAQQFIFLWLFHKCLEKCCISIQEINLYQIHEYQQNV